MIRGHLYSEGNKVPERLNNFFTCKRILIQILIDPVVNLFDYFCIFHLFQSLLEVWFPEICGHGLLRPTKIITTTWQGLDGSLLRC